MSRYEVIRTEREGAAAVELHDRLTGGRALVLTGAGNNLISYEQGGISVIPPPADLRAFLGRPGEWTWYGIPILFPPNRVPGGKLPFNGREYRLPINEPPDNHLHGELCRRAWEVAACEASETGGARVTARFVFAEHPDIMAYFPHELEFAVTHALRDGRLYTDVAVTNRGNDEALFAFGLHPYFAVPPGAAAKLTVPAAEEWPVTNLAFVAGPPSDTEFSRRLRGEGIDVGAFPALGCALVRLDGEKRVCRLEIPGRGIRIALEVGREFPFLVLFKPDWADAFSLEPYTCVTDAFNLPYPRETTGASGIQPGETVRLGTVLWLEKTE